MVINGLNNTFLTVKQLFRGIFTPPRVQLSGTGINLPIQGPQNARLFQISGINGGGPTLPSSFILFKKAIMRDAAYDPENILAAFKNIGDKSRHIENTFAAFQMIKYHDPQAIYNRLRDDIKTKTNKAEYEGAVTRLVEAFDALLPKEKLSLELAVLFHDVGHFVDTGWSHNTSGARLMDELKSARLFRGADFELIKKIIALHGMSANFGVDSFPSDINNLSKVEKACILIMDSVDIMGRADGNALNLRALKDFEKIFGPGFSDEEFYIFRLQRLLSPSPVSYVEDDALGQITREINGFLKTTEAKERFMGQLTKKLSVQCFPVFQEMVLKHKRIDLFAKLLEQIYFTIYSYEIREELAVRKVALTSSPDIFQTKPGSRGREVLMERLINNLGADKNVVFVHAAKVGELELEIRF